MSTKSILLKVSPEVHTGIQEAAGRHQRSMQVVLVALIERWLAAGGPDPLQVEMEKPLAVASEAVDREARLAIEVMIEQLKEFKEQVSGLSSNNDAESSGWGKKVLSTLLAVAEHQGEPGKPALHIALAEQQPLDRLLGQPPRVKTPLPEPGESRNSFNLTEKQERRKDLDAAALDAGG